MPMNYVLQKVEEMSKKLENLSSSTWRESSRIQKIISETENRLQLLEERTSEAKHESDISKIVTVKLTCDNSVFLQSLDEIEKKVDTIQDKMNQLINKH